MTARVEHRGIGVQSARVSVGNGDQAGHLRRTQLAMVSGTPKPGYRHPALQGMPPLRRHPPLRRIRWWGGVGPANQRRLVTAGTGSRGVYFSWVSGVAVIQALKALR